MKNVLFCLSICLISSTMACATECPAGYTCGATTADAGHIVGDAGPATHDSGPVTPTADAGHSPTPYRSCGASGMIPTRFRITVLDASNGPLGTCAAGWDPIAYALPVTGDIHVVGSDIDQLVRSEWAGEVDFNFMCGGGFDYASILPGQHPSDRGVRVEVFYGNDTPVDVSSRVSTATSPSGGTLFRLPLCSSYL